MNRDETKRILQSVTPDRMDPADPLLAEARAWLERDEELRLWFQEECAFDDAVRRKLHQAAIPPGLSKQILERSRPQLIRARFRRTILAAAAVLVFAAILAGWFLTRPRTTEPPDFAAFRQDMAAFLAEFPKLDFETERVVEMQNWLAQKPGLPSVRIPQELLRFPAIGCREINWRGINAALLCFMVDGEAIHLFVLREDSLHGNFPAQTSEFIKASAVHTRAWKDGPNLYLAATKGTSEFLNKHIRS